MATAAALLAGYGCNGPISDWPPKAGGGDDGIGTPVGPIGGGAPGGSRDAGAGPITSPGGTAAGSTPGAMGGATPGTPAGGTAGGAIAGGTAGGGTAGGSTADAGTATNMDAGANDAGASPDTAVGDPDAGDAGDGGDTGDAGDAGDAGWPTDAGCSFVPVDAGVVPGSDAGVCAAYGCGVTLTTLGQIAAPGSACASSQALSVACTGELARAAMICTQENALGLGLGRQVTACLRRASQFSQVPKGCLQCYADESLCTLSRCFVACIDGSDPACEQCRTQSCGEPFRKCSGLPQAR